VSARSRQEKRPSVLGGKESLSDSRDARSMRGTKARTASPSRDFCPKGRNGEGGGGGGVAGGGGEPGHLSVGEGFGHMASLPTGGGAAERMGLGEMKGPN